MLFCLLSNIVYVAAFMDELPERNPPCILFAVIILKVALLGERDGEIII